MCAHVALAALPPLVAFGAFIVPAWRHAVRAPLFRALKIAQAKGHAPSAVRAEHHPVAARVEHARSGSAASAPDAPYMPPFQQPPLDAPAAGAPAGEPGPKSPPPAHDGGAPEPTKQPALPSVDVRVDDRPSYLAVVVPPAVPTGGDGGSGNSPVDPGPANTEQGNAHAYGKAPGPAARGNAYGIAKLPGTPPADNNGAEHRNAGDPNPNDNNTRAVVSASDDDVTVEAPPEDVPEDNGHGNGGADPVVPSDATPDVSAHGANGNGGNASDPEKPADPAPDKNAPADPPATEDADADPPSRENAHTDPPSHDKPPSNDSPPNSNGNGKPSGTPPTTSATPGKGKSGK